MAETVPLAFHPLAINLAKDGSVPATHRPASRRTIQEATGALRRLIEVVELGELDVSTPKDVALLRRLQGTLAGWEEVLGKDSREGRHTE